MRAFVAVALPPDLVATFGACRAALLDADPSWRREKWVSDDALHLTLRFLGDIGEDAIDHVAVRLHDGLRSFPPFEVGFARLAAVPRPRAASLIWAEPAGPHEATERLAARVTEVVAGPVGPEPARERRFRTHVTLCRARSPRPIAPDTLALAAIPLVTAEPRHRFASVLSATLFTSTLTPSGPVYREVATVPLGG